MRGGGQIWPQRQQPLPSLIPTFNFGAQCAHNHSSKSTRIRPVVHPLSTMFVDAGTETKLTVTLTKAAAIKRTQQPCVESQSEQDLRASNKSNAACAISLSRSRSLSLALSIGNLCVKSWKLYPLNGQRNVPSSQVLSRPRLGYGPASLSVCLSAGLCLPRSRAWCQCRDFIAINFLFRPVYASCVRLTRPTAAAAAAVTFAAFRICVSCPWPSALPCCCCPVTSGLQLQLARGTP